MSLESLYLQAPGWAQTILLNAHAWRIERHRYGPRFRAALNDLLDSQSWPAERMRSYQDEQLRSIIRVAYEQSTYYQRTMRQLGLRPSDVRGVRDLAKFPVLSKTTVRSCEKELLTRGKPGRGWLHGHTTGTTGSPLSLWYDRNTCVMTNAADWLQKVWGGMRPGDWIGLLLGRVIVPLERSKPPFWRANYVQRQVWFSSFHMSDENLGAYVSEIRRRRLRFLEGYPSTLHVLAKYVLGQGVRLPMQAIFTSSETLHDIQREAIRKAFGCQPFDFYGLAERVMFAAECEEHRGKHVVEGYGYVEIVDDDNQPLPDGQLGYLVGTSLHNHAMPLLRYRTGDVSAIRRERCLCGRESVRIEDVTTKAEDIVVTPEGRMISPSVLTHPFKPFPQILKSQIIQERLEAVRVKIVPSSDFTPAHQRMLVESMSQRLGPRMEVAVELVDDIPRGPSGKYRWVVSNLDHGLRVSW